MKTWLSPAEIAEEVGVCSRTVLRWLRHGLPHKKLGTRTIRVRRVDLDAWLAAGPATEQPPPRLRRPVDEAARILSLPSRSASQ